MTVTVPKHRETPKQRDANIYEGAGHDHEEEDHRTEAPGVPARRQDVPSLMPILRPVARPRIRRRGASTLDAPCRRLRRSQLRLVPWRLLDQARAPLRHGRDQPWRAGGSGLRVSTVNARACLPNGRRQETIGLEFEGHLYSVSIGFDDDGRVPEVFVAGQRQGYGYTDGQNRGSTGECRIRSAVTPS